ncbi:MAG: hypothetical protein R3E89_07420 [Thiolinea sp.]
MLALGIRGCGHGGIHRCCSFMAESRDHYLTVEAGDVLVTVGNGAGENIFLLIFGPTSRHQGIRQNRGNT